MTWWLSGQDLGPAVREAWGDSDYECWLKIPAEAKDRVLLMLLELAYGGDGQVVGKVKGEREARGIACEFSAYA